MDKVFNTAVSGITIVFLALILLFIFVVVFTKILSLKNNYNHSAENVDKDISNTKNNGKNNKSMTDEELIAVFSAVACTYTRDRPDVKIKVKSFKRIQQKTPIWNAAGRKEQISKDLY